ncbi:MAG: lipid II:glycine glycyltransferase FemX, partial [Terriglobia bacterium]
ASGRKRVREIDPVHDPGWLELAERHPQASVFHTPAWLDALRRTYGYEPVVLTTSPSAGQIANGVVLCRVSSWLTGRRMVSLPFTDHCEPLVGSNEELRCILATLRDERSRKRWRYIEVRPVENDLSVFPGFNKSRTFCLHRLDLRPALEDLFRGFHKDCVQRKIWRAEREELTYEVGRSEPLLEKFYHLLVLTRRRQLSLPQPLAWFRNLIATMADKLKIHVVSKGGRPVASILTLSYKATLVYKYGCSDKRFSNLGGTHLIFWRAIQQAKHDGAVELDMGRSDWSDAGLIKFKDRWGATPSVLTYWRYGDAMTQRASALSNAPMARRIFGYIPNGLLATTGTLLYRHVG